jgi:hypothetical protein
VTAPEVFVKASLAVLSLGVTLAGAVAATLVNADDWAKRLGDARHDVAPAVNAQYRTACGDCHMAYQPGLLPAASWQRVMAGLGDHFGDNAELAPADADALRAYLVANAADRATGHRSHGFSHVGSPAAAPLRITETRYFLGKHDEVPARFVRDSPEVRSFANCPACHQRAEAGSYNEHEVRIPGVGAWDH